MQNIEKRHVLIPNIFTCLNLVGGFLAIWQMTEGHFHTAAWIIIIAVLFDMADGKLARHLDSESEFGFQLDSMADLITAGVAPSMMILYTANLPIMIRVISASMFLLSVAYRLARFNVHEKDERHHIYRGLPAPVAALTIVGFWFFRFRGLNLEPYAWAVLIFLLSGLMITGIPYKWPRVRFNEGLVQCIYSVLKLFITAAMTVFPSLFMFPCFIGYVIRGIVKFYVKISE
ncbi:CDP-diacylglycerol--serine O-phosphatidyltransferase [bacterium]|nr:CDP-diacylglycerol--serine O-phosphatidyltransferase [bacterium]